MVPDLFKELKAVGGDKKLKKYLSSVLRDFLYYFFECFIKQSCI